MATDLAITKDGDLEFSDDKLSTITAGEVIRQRLLVRLSTFRGTWFADPNFGVPYYQKVLGHQFNPVIMNAIFVKAITDTPGVVQLKEPIHYEWDRRLRVLTLSFTVIADTGEEISLYKDINV
ncbi:MAG TPA: hypothetical protein PKW95_20565 [bacterium]|nr:hypothetical protein [bacterium]